jgi:hypothetical protein
MTTGSLKKSLFEKDDLQREELKRELRRKIVAGSVLLSLHKKETMKICGVSLTRN